MISSIGSQMQIVAIAWHVYLLTHSAIALGLVGLIGTIPLVIFSFIGGIYADKHNRKTILLIVQIASTILAIALSFATYTHTVSVFFIYVIVGLSSITDAFRLPAAQSLVPKFVKREHLSNAMSLNFIMRQIATVIGPAIAGFTIASYGVGSIYVINALSFLSIIIALLLIKTNGRVEGIPPTASIHAIKEGIHFIRSKTIIWSTMLLDFFCTFFSSVTSLLPIFAKDILKVGPQGMGFLYAAPSVGAIIAGFFVSHMDQVKTQGRIILLSVLLYGIGTILFGFSKSFIISLFSLALLGVGDSISTIVRNTIRQLETPDNIRGRMTSINMIFFMSGPQLGEFEAGVLAAIAGGPFSVISGGIATIVCVGLIAYLVPTLKDYTASK